MIVPSTGALEMIKCLGIPAERITMTPYSVDNPWWKSQSAKVDRRAVRSQWGVSEQQSVILFCAKLQLWKRPMDLLRAFADAKLSQAVLVFAGDGPQREELEAQAARLGLQQRVRFLGFVNQSQLPAIYTSADVMVLPSIYEPFAVVVNEAMCCGCPVMVSDRVGAARDLVAPVRADFVFQAGDTAALTRILRTALADPKVFVKRAADLTTSSVIPRRNCRGHPGSGSQRWRLRIVVSRVRDHNSPAGRSANSGRPLLARCLRLSPDIGGGSAQLRSHLALPYLDVEWFYLSKT